MTVGNNIGLVGSIDKRNLISPYAETHARMLWIADAHIRVSLILKSVSITRETVLATCLDAVCMMETYIIIIDISPIQEMFP